MERNGSDKRFWRAVCVLLAAWAAAGGCIGKHPRNPSATQPATAIDPILAEPSYWLAKPATDIVAGSDFTTLWEAAEDVARECLFKIDRRDFRAGLLTTQPMVSKQWFEPWRKDAGTWDDVEESSVAPIRRTLYFEFSQAPAGGYFVTPKVVVERQSRVDPKYRSDAQLPSSYWYALRRDTVMESRLAGAIRGKLHRDLPTRG